MTTTRLASRLSLPLIMACTCAALADQTNSNTTASPTTNNPAKVSTTTAAYGATAPGAGLVNDWLRTQNPDLQRFDIGAQFRVRYEYRSYSAVRALPPYPGAFDFRADTTVPVNDYVLFRTRVHAGYAPVDWFLVYGEGQNSTEVGDKRSPSPAQDGPFDLHQGYA